MLCGGKGQVSLRISLSGWVEEKRVDGLRVLTLDNWP